MHHSRRNVDYYAAEAPSSLAGTSCRDPSKLFYFLRLTPCDWLMRDSLVWHHCRKRSWWTIAWPHAAESAACSLSAFKVSSKICINLRIIRRWARQALAFSCEGQYWYEDFLTAVHLPQSVIQSAWLSLVWLMKAHGHTSSKTWKSCCCPNAS